MGMPERCARRPGLCEPWGRVYCDPAPGQVTRMIALPGERTCVGWCPDDIWQQCLCSAGSAGDCPEWAGCAPLVAYRWCMVVGESMPAMPPCGPWPLTWASPMAMVEARLRWANLPLCLNPGERWGDTFDTCHKAG